MMCGYIGHTARADQEFPDPKLKDFHIGEVLLLKRSSLKITPVVLVCLALIYFRSNSNKIFK